MYSGIRQRKNKRRRQIFAPDEGVSPRNGHDMATWSRRLRDDITYFNTFLHTFLYNNCKVYNYFCCLYFDRVTDVGSIRYFSSVLSGVSQSFH